MKIKSCLTPRKSWLKLMAHYGVALRTGHHCAMPVMQFFGVPATARVSFGLYNTQQEVDVFVDALLKVREMF
jgi:cysteine desulfurase/selenocysteine lyase